MHYANITRNGKTKPVKNLGWLMSHWKEIERFEVWPCDTDSMIDAILVAYLGDGTVYRSTYASAELLRSFFLDRSIFRGRSVDWYIHDNGTRRAAVSKEII